MHEAPDPTTYELRALRPLLRQHLERASHWLEIYGLLLSWRALPALQGKSPQATESFRSTLEALVKPPQRLPLALQTRAVLCHLLHEVETHELSAFAQALLEHVAVALEPTLQLALLDPLQSPQYRAMLEHYGLEERPVEALLLARELRKTLPLETQVRPVMRRRKLSA